MSNKPPVLSGSFESRILYYQASNEATALRHLHNFPDTGDGVHATIGKFTSEVARRGLWIGNDGYVHQLIQDAAANCGREVTECEIQNLLDGARDYWSSYPKPKREPKLIFPNFDPALINKLEEIEEGYLLDSSPVRGLDILKPDWFINELFPGDLLICVGKQRSSGKRIWYDCKTQKFKDFREGELATWEFIVPSYMTAKRGLLSTSKNKTKDQLTEKDYGEHTSNNTGERMYLIIENDKHDKVKQERILYHFSKKLPLVCIVDSGGKSLHGWFNCAGEKEDKIMKILKEACRHGGDNKMRYKSQFCRLPNGKRSTGEKQSVLYFDPENTVKGK
jgi:hypothetical protein